MWLTLFDERREGVQENLPDIYPWSRAPLSVRVRDV